MIDTSNAGHVQHTLERHGFSGLRLRMMGGVATLSGGLPDTEEARQALFDAFDEIAGGALHEEAAGH